MATQKLFITELTKPDFSIFKPSFLVLRITHKKQAHIVKLNLLRKRERLLGKYTLSEDTSAVNKIIPFASVLC